MRSRWVFAGALLVAVMVQGAQLVRGRLQPSFASINIRWAEEIDDLRRLAIERELDLRAPQSAGGRTWSYRIDDFSPRHIGVIVGHPAVADTAYVDRPTLTAERIAQDPPPPVSPSVTALRSGALAVALVAGLMAAGVHAAGKRLVRVIDRVVGVTRAALVEVPGVIGALTARVLGLFSRPNQAALLFAAGFVPLAAWSVAADARHPAWRAGTIYQRGLPLPTPDEFLSQDPELLDHDVYYHGLYGWVDRARQADVIFTGNSRAVYAFRTEAVKPHFDRLGLTYYNLAFAGGADRFPLALMRRYDIWPKVLVINVHGFFDDDYTRFGVWAMARDWFTGWNFVWERQASWNLRYRLHQMLPHWPTLHVHRKASQVIYRDVTDGSWRWVLPIIVPMPLGNVPARDWANEEERLDIEKWRTRIAANAPGYIAELESHGTTVVLVFVPVPDAVTYYAAVEGAEALGRPLVVAWPAGLMGASGSHMGLASARRYLDALMPKLLAMDEFQAILPAQEVTR